MTNETMKWARDKWHANRESEEAWDAFLKIARAYLTERGWRLSEDQTFWQHCNYSVFKIDDAVTIQLDLDDNLTSAKVEGAMRRWSHEQAVFESIASAFLINHCWVYSIEHRRWVHPKISAKSMLDAIKAQLKGCA